MSLANWGDCRPWTPRVLIKPRIVQKPHDTHIILWRAICKLRTEGGFGRIVRVVTVKYAVTLEDIRSQKRSKQLFMARAELSHLLIEKTSMSTARIGQLLRRDHSVIIRRAVRHQKGLR